MVLFEPRADVPLTDQPVLLELLTMPRRQLRNPWRWLFTVAGAVVVLLPGHPVGIALPAFVALGGLAGLLAAARATRFVPRREFTAVTGSPVREVRATDLCQAGRVVALRLPDEQRWAVGRLPASDAMLLARLRRAWVFGPSPKGWLGLVVPGGAPTVVRLADTPPSGAEPVPEPVPPAQWPPPPRDDPPVRWALSMRLRASVYSLVVVVLAMAGVTVDALVVASPAPVVTWSVAVVFLALLVVATAPDLGRVRRAARSTRWAWDRVVTEEPRFLGSSRMKLRATLSVAGDDLALEVSGPPALVLAVHESGQLWLIGDPHPTRPMIVGIPEVPVLGRARRSFTPTR